MNLNTNEDTDFNILKRQFLNFFDKEPFYVSEIRRLSERGETRLTISLNAIRTFDIGLAKKLLSNPIKAIPPLESALFDLAKSKAPADKQPKAAKSFKVGFEGSFGENLVAPRQMSSALLTKLVCVEGIATKLSLVSPKRLETVHFCEKTKSFSSRIYSDVSNFDLEPSSSAIPAKDADGNPLTLEFGYSTYIDHQRIFVQDMPERSSAGQMPRNVEVIVENDLVDKCKPGDRVKITGVYRAVPRKAAGTTGGMYRTVLIANHVKVTTQLPGSQLMTEKDIAKIRKISKESNLLARFAKSIAPSLYGREIIKKAVVLLLLGGEEKILENKTHIRGDINMLLVGDPSVGKSQLLRAIMQVAKLSVSTTGKGSTGVGLTAAVLTNRETGERYLEAGATVLADRGVICIDEFDKMSEIDRTAIHEVMEQQTVTIAKAGIHTSLNARCSVVAAANPIYSSYDASKSPQQNIPLPDSLLSRFDVLFVVLDQLDPDKDRLMGEHVLRNHRYNSKSSLNGDLYERCDDAGENEEETEIYERFDRLLHEKAFVEKFVGSNRTKKRKKLNRFFTLEFIRKYIEYAKTRFHPVLTKKAAKRICAAYCQIRNREATYTLPITARYVETMIRFATAHAKLRLSKKVEKEDVDEILAILLFSLGSDEQLFQENSEKENESPKTSKKRKKAAKKAEKEAEIEEGGKSSNIVSQPAKKLVMALISEMSRQGELELRSDAVFKSLAKSSGKEMSRGQFDAVLAELEEANRVMVVEGVIHPI